MAYQRLIETMTLETYTSLKRSLEMGKWPDGKTLTREQRENAMQAIIAWGRLHLPEQDRVGYINRGHKAGEICDEPEQAPLTWKE